MDVVNQILAPLLDFLLSEAAAGVLITWLLTQVPGPFRGIARNLANMLLERLKNMKDERFDARAERLVLANEQELPEAAGEAKKAKAMAALTKSMPPEEANDRIEAAVARVKGEALDRETRAKVEKMNAIAATHAAGANDERLDQLEAELLKD